MMRRPFQKIVAILLPVLFVSASLNAQEPKTYTAVYQAQARGMTSLATRSLQRDDGQFFTLENSMDVKVAGVTLGSIEETSQFQWTDGTLLPNNYTYDQSGISNREEEVRFDWNNGVATSSEDDESWQLDLMPGVADKLSYQLLLRQRLTADTTGEFELKVVDGDEIETHLFRVSGTEEIETLAGAFNTLKVERIRENPRGRSTVFWLASDWDLLLVRFLQTESSGSTTELILQQATIDGQVVTPLP